MKVSLSNGCIFELFGIDEGFKMIREAGFEAIEFCINYFLPSSATSSGKLTTFFDQTDEEILEAVRPYKEAAEKYGVFITQAHSPFQNRFLDDYVTEYVYKAVEKSVMICNYLGCPRLVVHPGFLPYGNSNADEWEFNINMYTRLIPTLKKYGVMCCLENMFRANRGRVIHGPADHPAEVHRYLDTLNGIAGERCFGYCLDIGHAVLISYDLHDLIVELGKDYIDCLHIHDNDGVSDQHVISYQGVADWNAVCRGLKEIGYTGDLNFETGNSYRQFPPELVPQVLELNAATGDLFRRRILG